MTREGGSGLCADAGEPDGVQRMLRGEVPSGMEGGAARWPIADDSCHVDLGAAKLVAADIDQAGVLLGVPSTDLRPRWGLGLVERDLFGRAHASIISRPTARHVSGRRGSDAAPRSARAVARNR